MFYCQSKPSTKFFSSLMFLRLRLRTKMSMLRSSTGFLNNLQEKFGEKLREHKKLKRVVDGKERVKHRQRILESHEQAIQKARVDMKEVLDKALNKLKDKCLKAKQKLKKELRTQIQELEARRNKLLRCQFDKLFRYRSPKNKVTECFSIVCLRMITPSQISQS